MFFFVPPAAASRHYMSPWAVATMVTSHSLPRSFGVPFLVLQKIGRHENNESLSTTKDLGHRDNRDSNRNNARIQCVRHRPHSLPLHIPSCRLSPQHGHHRVALGKWLSITRDPISLFLLVQEISQQDGLVWQVFLLFKTEFIRNLATFPCNRRHPFLKMKPSRSPKYAQVLVI
jgi:hypothetical protein